MVLRLDPQEAGILCRYETKADPQGKKVQMLIQAPTLLLSVSRNELV